MLTNPADQNGRAVMTLEQMKEILTPAFILAVANASGTFIELNEHFRKAFGYEPAELTLQDLTVADQQLPTDEAWKELIGVAKEYGQWSGKLFFYTKTGELIWVRAIVMVYEQQENALDELLLIINDTGAREERDSWREIACLHDLTGLPNRRAFHLAAETYLQRADRSGMKLSFLYTDIDRFKTINDTYGHSVGDEVLKECGRRFKELQNEENGVFHFSGDEFVFMYMYEEDVFEQVKKVQAAVTTPFQTSRGPLQVELSIGISVYPDDSRDIGKLLDRADVSMLTAKQRKKGTVIAPYCS